MAQPRSADSCAENYPSFAQVLATGRKQVSVSIPVNSFAKAEGVFACTQRGCAYFAKTETELTWHIQCQHPTLPSPNPKQAAPPVSLESESVASESLGEAMPAMPAKAAKRKSAIAEQEDQPEGEPEEDTEGIETTSTRRS